MSRPLSSQILNWIKKTKGRSDANRTGIRQIISISKHDVIVRNTFSTLVGYKPKFKN